MGKVNDGVLKAWKDGEIVYANDYTQEREIIRTALNDNYNRLIKKYEVIDSAGLVKTTQTLDTAINYINFKETDQVVLTLDNTTSTLTIGLVDGSVTTAKLANLGVTTAKIADGNVTTIKIADGGVTTAKLALQSVSADKIADLNVTTAKIADLNVTTTKIADRNITRDKIALGAVGADELDPNLSSDVELNQHKGASTLDHPDGSVTRIKLNTEVTTELDGLRTDVDSKEVVIHQAATAPTNTTKLWIDTSTTPNVWKRHDGTSWIKATPTAASEVGAPTAAEFKNQQILSMWGGW